MIDIPFSEHYMDNRKADYASEHGNCIVCGKAVKSPKHYVRLWNGFTAVTDDEANTLTAEGKGGGDTGYVPVGANCLRQHPELKPYVDDAKKASELVEQALKEAAQPAVIDLTADVPTVSAPAPKKYEPSEDYIPNRIRNLLSFLMVGQVESVVSDATPRTYKVEFTHPVTDGVLRAIRFSQRITLEGLVDCKGVIVTIPESWLQSAQKPENAPILQNTKENPLNAENAPQTPPALESAAELEQASIETPSLEELMSVPEYMNRDGSVKLEYFGHDHWATLLFLETIAVDQRGKLSFDDRRMRTYQYGSKKVYYTRLRGGIEYEEEQHDDWACMMDLYAAGLLEDPDNADSEDYRIRLTNEGLRVAALLRAWKADKKLLKDFTPDAGQSDSEARLREETEDVRRIFAGGGVADMALNTLTEQPSNLRAATEKLVAHLTSEQPRMIESVMPLPSIRPGVIVDMVAADNPRFADLDSVPFGAWEDVKPLTDADDTQELPTFAEAAWEQANAPLVEDNGIRLREFRITPQGWQVGGYGELSRNGVCRVYHVENGARRRVEHVTQDEDTKEWYVHLRKFEKPVRLLTNEALTVEWFSEFMEPPITLPPFDPQPGELKFIDNRDWETRAREAEHELALEQTRRRHQEDRSNEAIYLAHFDRLKGHRDDALRWARAWKRAAKRDRVALKNLAKLLPELADERAKAVKIAEEAAQINLDDLAKMADLERQIERLNRELIAARNASENAHAAAEYQHRFESMKAELDTERDLRVAAERRAETAESILTEVRAALGMDVKGGDVVLEAQLMRAANTKWGQELDELMHVTQRQAGTLATMRDAINTALKDMALANRPTLVGLLRKAINRG